MNPVEYTKKLRRVATVSWLGSLAVFLILVWLKILPVSAFFGVTHWNNTDYYICIVEQGNM